jgi:hypothetical protein
MSGFDNELTGILSRNDRKEKDTHPDFKGNATINGVDYWIDAWVQERKDGSGRKFFKLKFKAKDQAQAGAGKPRAQADEEMSDDIPF